MPIGIGLGVRSVKIDAANTFVLRSGVSVWYDVNKKVGVSLRGDYTVARPRITVTSSAGADTRRLHADMFSLGIGVVYSIF